MTVIAIRTVIIYVYLILALRVTGKRQIGELQPIELVVTLLISDLAVIPMQESSIPLISGLVPIAVLVCLELILSTLMMKSGKLSTLISGNPVVVIQDGVVQQNALRQLRLGIDDLSESLRQQQVFDMKAVSCAVAETSGKISVFLNPKSKEKAPAVPVVNDGQPVAWGLSFCGFDEQWLEEELATREMAMDGVLFMSADETGIVQIVEKEVGR